LENAVSDKKKEFEDALKKLEKRIQDGKI